MLHGSGTDEPCTMTCTIIRTVLLLGILTFASITLAAEKRYDILLDDGTIHDGSGQPGFIGDVGIRDDRIVAIGDLDPAVSRRVMPSSA